MKMKRFAAAAIAAMMCAVPIMHQSAPITYVSAEAVSYADIPSEYITACDWVWNNRIYDDENEDWMKNYATIYDQLIAGNGTIYYLIRWDSYQTITYEQRQQLEVVLNEALNKWNDCLEGYENWPFDDVNVKIMGWSVLDKNSLQDLHSDEVVYTETMDSTMRDYIIEASMAADASAIPTLEPSEPTDLSRYVHWSDKSWTYNGSYENRYDMFLEGINGLIDMGGFGWHYGQYLSSNAILGLLDGTTSQHVLLHEMGHGFGFPDYYGGIMDKIKFEIKETYGILSTTPGKWNKEFNLVSWNEAEPKYDLRQWAPDHSSMGKGISLNREEAESLFKYLRNLFGG